MKPWISSSGGPDPACQYRQVTPSMVTLHSSAPAIRATVGTMGSVFQSLCCRNFLHDVQPTDRSANPIGHYRLCRFYGEPDGSPFFAAAYPNSSRLEVTAPSGSTAKFLTTPRYSSTAQTADPANNHQPIANSRNNNFPVPNKHK